MSHPSDQAERELISTSLEVEQLDTVLYRSKSLWAPSRERGVYGGQVISQALVSATKTIKEEYALHSLHCYFLQNASTIIPIIYFVEPIRRGRSYITRSVKASQSGRLIFLMICSFQKPEPMQLKFQVIPPGDVPSPETLELEEDRCERLATDESLHPKQKDWYLSYAQDRRRSPIETRFVREGPNERQGFISVYWMKIRKSGGLPDKFERSFQKCMLAYISDLKLIPTASRALGLSRGSGSRQQSMISSLDHSMFFYDHEFDCLDYLLCVMSCSAAAHGRAVTLGRVYARDGILVAALTQEGVLRINPGNETEAVISKMSTKL